MCVSTLFPCILNVNNACKILKEESVDFYSVYLNKLCNNVGLQRKVTAGSGIVAGVIGKTVC